VFEFVENLQPLSAAVQRSAWLRGLVKEVLELSLDAFEENTLEMVTKRARWKLTLIVRSGGPSKSEAQEVLGVVVPVPALIGFVIYRLRPELESVSIAKLAVMPEFRRQGHGCRLVEWCVHLARRAPGISRIALSSLPEAVCFYQRLGFRKYDVNLDQSCGPNEDLVEGQVYMEKSVRGGRGARRRSG